MNNRFQILIAFFIGISFSLQAQQEESTFEIIHNEKSIGELKITKEIRARKTIYTDHTSIIAHIIMKINLDYKYKSTYIDNQLFESNELITLNGNQRSKTSTKKTSSGYTFYEDDKVENKINQSINFSTIRLMFEEPKNISKVYAEEHGVFHTLKKIGDHTYVKTSPEGHQNTYYYQNGALQKAKVDVGIISFDMIRKSK